MGIMEVETNAEKKGSWIFIHLTTSDLSPDGVDAHIFTFQFLQWMGFYAFAQLGMLPF